MTILREIEEGLQEPVRVAYHRWHDGRQLPVNGALDFPPLGFDDDFEVIHHLLQFDCGKRLLDAALERGGGNSFQAFDECAQALKIVVGGQRVLALEVGAEQRDGIAEVAHFM